MRNRMVKEQRKEMQECDKGEVVTGMPPVLSRPSWLDIF
jgi:hypothetical protein